MMNRFSAFLTAIALIVSLSSFAQDERYTAAMQKGMAQLREATSTEDMTAVVNHFERVAQAESEEWLPGYYAAYTLSMQSFMTENGEEKDDLLDKAQEWIDHIQPMAPEESEILVMQAMIYQARIQVDFMARGAEMSMLQASTLAEAEELNPENPRVFLLRGQNTYYTPEFFGGGAEAAKPILETAKAKFEAFETENELAPAWGNGRLEYLLARYEE